MKFIVTFFLLFLTSCGSMEYAPSKSEDFGTFEQHESANAGRIR